MLVMSTEPQIHDGGTGCNPAHLVERGMEQLSGEDDNRRCVEGASGVILHRHCNV